MLQNRRNINPRYYQKKKKYFIVNRRSENKIKEENVFELDEDYSEYEYRNWTPKKQLNSITLYDRIIENFQGITLNDKKILKGMLCEYFITDANEIHNIPKENINKTYKELLEKI